MHKKKLTNKVLIQIHNSTEIIKLIRITNMKMVQQNKNLII